MSERKDPVIALLEKTAQELGSIDDHRPDDYLEVHDAIAKISTQRYFEMPRSEKPTLISFIEALAEKAAIDTARRECIQAKVKYFESRRKMYQTAQNLEMAKTYEIVTAVLEGILPETNPNVEQNEKALLEYLEKKTAKAIERTC